MQDKGLGMEKTMVRAMAGDGKNQPKKTCAPRGKSNPRNKGTPRKIEKSRGNNHHFVARRVSLRPWILEKQAGD